MERFKIVRQALLSKSAHSERVGRCVEKGKGILKKRRTALRLGNYTISVRTVALDRYALNAVQRRDITLRARCGIISYIFSMRYCED